MITITVTRKPLSEPTVALNVLAHGTGALNIDGCRVPTAENTGRPCGTHGFQATAGGFTQSGELVTEGSPLGRWPANLIHDGSEEVVARFPVTTSGGGNKSGRKDRGVCYGRYGAPQADVREVDSGSAARFFYCVNVNKTESSGRKP